MMIAAAALALGWATAACADDWGEIAQVSATMGVHDGRICLGEGSRGDLGCPSYAPQVMSSGLLSATNISATGAVQAVHFIGDGSGLTNLIGSDRIVSGTSSVAASQDRSVTLATAGSTRVIVGENGYVGLGNFIGANPTSELHIVSSRTSGLAPYMLLQAGKAQYSAAAVALQRAASTQQMLIGFETGSSSQPDGYIGTLANKPRAIYVHTGQGLSNQTAVGIEGEGSTAGLRIGTGTNIDSGRPGAIISSSGIAFFGGNAGEPSVTMHVSGTVRIADGGEPCDSNRRGAIRYTSATTFDFCDGVSGWRSLAATASAGGVTTDRIVSGTTSLIASQDRSVTISKSGSVSMVIGENGRIGMGMAIPREALEVSGSLRLTLPGGSQWYVNLGADTSGRFVVGNSIKFGTGNTIYNSNSNATYYSMDGYLHTASTWISGNTSQNGYTVKMFAPWNPNLPGYAGNISYVSGSLASTAVTTFRGQRIEVEDNSSAIANSVVGLSVQVSGSNTAGQRDVAHFMGGNVGIGTSTPSRTLTVNGDADVSGTMKIAGTGSEACGPALRGTIRQNPISKKLEICRF